MVNYYLSARPDLLLEDEVLFLKVMAYFEWYVNDLKTDWRIHKYKLAGLMEARNMLRQELGIDVEEHHDVVIAELRRLAQEIEDNQNMNRSDMNEQQENG